MIRDDEINEWLEKIEAEEAAERAYEEKKANRGRPQWTSLYVDEDILILDKPAGIAVIPERHGEDDSLRKLAGLEYGHLWTVHRLDKDTSGVLLFARNAESHRILNEQFRERETTKRYSVIVEGEMSQNEIPVDVPLATDGRGHGLVRPSANGKEAITILRSEEEFRGFTLIDAQPLTGRQHQIRVHCKVAGLPLLVDPLYGNRSEFFLSTIKRKFRDYGRDERPLMSRLTLHARELGFTHPSTGERVTFTSEPPKDFRAVITQLRKNRPAL